MTTRFIYNGPPSGFTLRRVDAKGAVSYQDVSLIPGKEVELEATNYVKSLIARGLLTEAKADKPPKTADTASQAFQAADTASQAFQAADTARVLQADHPKPPKNTPKQRATEVANG